MYATHVLATLLSNHRRLAIAAAAAVAFAIIAAVTLYIQARTGTLAIHYFGAQPDTWYHGMAPQSWYHGHVAAIHYLGAQPGLYYHC